MMRGNWIIRSPARWIALVCLVMIAGCTKVKTTDELIADLKSAQDHDRIAAARLLPQRREDAAKVIPALIESLGDHDADVRASAAIGLGSFGEQAADATARLQKLAKDRDARVRRAAATALERIRPKSEG